MKTFLQFCEDSGNVGDSTTWSDNQMNALYTKMGVGNKAKREMDVQRRELTRDVEKQKENEFKQQMADDAEKRKVKLDAKKMELMDRQLKNQEDEAKKQDLRQAGGVTKSKDKYAQNSQTTNEVYDPEVQGRSQIRKSGEGGRVGRDRRKSEGSWWW